MFGYLQIQKSELLVREYEAYKAVYCGLCKQMGKDYSFLTRFTLSYDCTFYAMLLMSLDRSCVGFKDSRCTSNPLKKCKFALCKNDSYSKAAAFSVITSYYKLKDDILDSSFLKRNFYRLLLPFFSHQRKMAVKKHGYADLDQIVSQMMSEQLADEQDESSTIDSSAHPTAKMLASVLALESKNETQRRVYYEFGYHLGRWIYLIDAADDIQKDTKNSNFNPFVKSNNASNLDYIDSVLNQSLARAYDAYNLIEVTDFKSILDNMLLKGFPAVQNRILKAQEKIINEKKAKSSD